MRLPSGGANMVHRKATSAHLTSHQADHRFANLTYDDFRKLAVDPSLSCYEKIGFPNSYREGKEEAIFQDIVSKIPALTGRQKTVLDIGPGCSHLAHMLVNLCQQ
jgi:hypothetical protein